MELPANISPWRDSKLPFYIVLQDKSQSKLRPIKQESNDEFVSIDYDKIINDSKGTILEDGELFEVPINIYPEIRYRFIDDEEIDIGSSFNSDDIVIILDFDLNGDKIVEIKSLSNVYQVYDVKKFKNTKITFEGINNKENTNNVIIKGTNCSVDLLNEQQKVNDKEEDINEEDSIEDIRNMVKLFNKRNKQLEHMIGLLDKFPI